MVVGVSVIVTLGTAHLDFAMLTEPSHRRKVLPMVQGHRGERRRRRRIFPRPPLLPRWCVGGRIETAGGVFHESTNRFGAFRSSVAARRLGDAEQRFTRGRR
jgi:hypothetical protein